MKNLNFIQQLVIPTRRADGRNSFGRITSFHRAGGHSRRYRCVDFFRCFDNTPAIVRRFERDPNRNASIAVICYYNEVLSYILAPIGLVIGTVIFSSNFLIPEIGNNSQLRSFASGSFIHNLEVWPGSGGRFIRSCGMSAQVLKQYDDYFTVVKLRTGEQRLFDNRCRATMGVPTQFYTNYHYKSLEKAGRARWMGRRPIVRGVAMNPVDHPHGGAGGRVDRSPWGWFTKGPRTTRIKMVRNILRTRRQKN